MILHAASRDSRRARAQGFIIGIPPLPSTTSPPVCKAMAAACSPRAISFASMLTLMPSCSFITPNFVICDTTRSKILLLSIFSVMHGNMSGVPSVPTTSVLSRRAPRREPRRFKMDVGVGAGPRLIRAVSQFYFRSQVTHANFATLRTRCHRHQHLQSVRNRHFRLINNPNTRVNTAKHGGGD